MNFKKYLISRNAPVLLGDSNPTPEEWWDSCDNSYQMLWLCKDAGVPTLKAELLILERTLKEVKTERVKHIIRKIIKELPEQKEMKQIQSEIDDLVGLEHGDLNIMFDCYHYSAHIVRSVIDKGFLNELK